MTERNTRIGGGRLAAVARGFRRMCPRCGRGRLFCKWYTLHERCLSCGLEFEPQEGDTWAFMYLSTGFLTGLIIVGMLLIRPPSLLLGQVAVGAIAVASIIGTLPFRKGAAIALDYLTKHRERAGEDRDSDVTPT